jgi:hypothetical protein
MLDVAALAEKLLAEGPPSQTKVASAPVFVAVEGEHAYAASLRKIAHLVLTEGITVQHLDLDDVLSGAAVMKIAADEEPPMGSALAVHPLAVEARRWASELRKHAADERRAKIASMERELEEEILAIHEKRANDYLQGHPPMAGGQNPQKTQSHGAGPGAMAALGAAGVGAGLAAPHVADRMGSHYQDPRSATTITSSDGADVSPAPAMPTHPYDQAIDGLKPDSMKPNVDELDAAKWHQYFDSLTNHGAQLLHPPAVMPPVPSMADQQHALDSLMQHGQAAYGHGADLARSLFGGP